MGVTEGSGQQSAWPRAAEGHVPVYRTGCEMGRQSDTPTLTLPAHRIEESAALLGRE